MNDCSGKLINAITLGPGLHLTLSPDSEAFFYSRQKFQNILIRLELLAGELEIEPKPSLETIKKNLDAILASCNEYAKFLRDLQKSAADQLKEKLTE